MVEQTRTGIVDMGSNAIRFMIAEASGTEHRIVESHRLAVRLGLPVFQKGKIPAATIADIVDAFRRFRTSCDHQGAQLRRAIATSAMRDARNRDLLVDRVRQASGFEIDVISLKNSNSVWKGCENRHFGRPLAHQKRKSAWKGCPN